MNEYCIRRKPLERDSATSLQKSHADKVLQFAKTYQDEELLCFIEGYMEGKS